MARHLTLRIPGELAGQRLDAAVPTLVPELTRAQAQRLLTGPGAALDGKPVKPAHRLRGGEALALTIPDPEPSGLVAQDLPLAVLLEDEDLLVLDKAPGMVVHPARGAPHSTVLNALLHRLGGASAVARLGLVHRLDKETSGCLVVAKSAPALAALQAAFKARAVEKRYLALAHGAVEAQGSLDTPYGRHPRDRTRFTTRVQSTRRAVTSWRVRERFAGAELVEVELHTGRTHQIRVHFAEAGHPLLADAVYGGTRREARLEPGDPVRRAAAAIGRQALHAWHLAFPHPRTGARVEIEAPLPKDFAAALEVLRAPAGGELGRDARRQSSR